MSNEFGERSPQKPWRPNADFFLSDPRSAELREVCIGIVTRIEDLSEDPETRDNEERKLTLYAELELLGGRLIEMGIEPNMNEGLPQSTYQASPVISAEWLAGQLYEFTGHTVTPISDVIRIIEEFDESEIAGVSGVDMSQAPNKLKDFVVNRQIVASLGSLLDIPKPTGEDTQS